MFVTTGVLWAQFRPASAVFGLFLSPNISIWPLFCCLTVSNDSIPRPCTTPNWFPLGDFVFPTSILGNSNEYKCKSDQPEHRQVSLCQCQVSTHWQCVTFLRISCLKSLSIIFRHTWGLHGPESINILVGSPPMTKTYSAWLGMVAQDSKKLT